MSEEPRFKDGAGPAGFRVEGRIERSVHWSLYRAKQPRLDRRVTLMVLRGDGTRGAIERRLRELHAHAATSHPGRIVVHELDTLRTGKGRSRATACLEECPDGSLATSIARGTRIAWSALEPLLAPVADAVSDGIDRGETVPIDLDTIFVTAEGRLKTLLVARRDPRDDPTAERAVASFGCALWAALRGRRVRSATRRGPNLAAEANAELASLPDLPESIRTEICGCVGGERESLERLARTLRSRTAPALPVEASPVSIERAAPSASDERRPADDLVPTETGPGDECPPVPADVLAEPTEAKRSAIRWLQDARTRPVTWVIAAVLCGGLVGATVYFAGGRGGDDSTETTDVEDTASTNSARRAGAGSTVSSPSVVRPLDRPTGDSTSSEAEIELEIETARRLARDGAFDRALERMRAVPPADNEAGRRALARTIDAIEADRLSHDRLARRLDDTRSRHRSALLRGDFDAWSLYGAPNDSEPSRLDDELAELRREMETLDADWRAIQTSIGIDPRALATAVDTRDLRTGDAEFLAAYRARLGRAVLRAVAERPPAVVLADEVGVPVTEFDDGRVELHYAFREPRELEDFPSVHAGDGERSRVELTPSGLTLDGECRYLRGDPFRGALEVQWVVRKFDPAAPHIAIALWTGEANPVRYSPSAAEAQNESAIGGHYAVFALGYRPPGAPSASLDVGAGAARVPFPCRAVILGRRGESLHRSLGWRALFAESTPARGNDGSSGELDVAVGIDPTGAFYWSEGDRSFEVDMVERSPDLAERLAVATGPGSFSLFTGQSPVTIAELRVRAFVDETWSERTADRQARDLLRRVRPELLELAGPRDGEAARETNR